MAVPVAAAAKGAGGGKAGMPKGGMNAMAGIGAVASVGASALKTTGTIMSMQADADQEVSDYKNWAYNNMAMQIQQGQEKAQLQDNQARQSASQQVGISAGGLGLSSTSAMTGQITTGRAQGQETRNQNVSQMLQNMEMQQAKRNMETHYTNQRNQQMIGGFADAFNSTAKAADNYNKKNQANNKNEEAANNKNEKASSYLSGFGKK